MKKTLFLLCAIVLFLCGAAQALAQTTGSMPPGPPKILQIFREDVKVGKGAAHEKLEAAFAQAFKKAKWPTIYLAMSSVTGPGEVWFLVPFVSFEAWEKDQQAAEKNAALMAELTKLGEKEGEFVSGGRSIAAIYREDLSPHPNVSIAQMRYFRVITFRVRPGHEGDFAEAVKIVRGAYEKAKVDQPWAVFQVSAGMLGPTFMVFLPTKSLQEIDASLVRSGKIQEAEGEEGATRLQKIAADAYLSVESNIYAFSPKMSYVSKEFAAGDPDFWTPKPKTTAKPVGGASAEKKEAKLSAAPAKKEGAKKTPPKK